MGWLGCLYRELISAARVPIVIRMIYKFLVSAGTPKIRFFAFYGRWEALDACEILPRGMGTICPFFEKSHLGVDALPIDDCMCSPIFHFLLCFKQSGTGKMTVSTVGSYHCFHEK